MSNRLFAAYGVGVNRAEMAKRCPTAKLLGASTLRNHRLTFRGAHAAAVANIEPEKGWNVPVLVWEITSADEAALDLYEGFPHLFEKQQVRLRLGGKFVNCMTYVMRGDRPIAVVTVEQGTSPATTGTSIGGKLWLDANGDGVMDADEAGIEQYPVNLYMEGDPSTAQQSVYTQADGTYRFENLSPGNYVVGVSSQTLADIEYLLPEIGISGDNQFVLSDDGTACYSAVLALAADSEVTNINAALRENIFGPPSVFRMPSAYANLSLGGNTIDSADTGKLVVMTADGDPLSGYYKTYTTDISGLRAALWDIYVENNAVVDYIMYFGADVSIGSTGNAVFANTTSASSAADVTFASLQGRLGTLVMTGTLADPISNNPATSTPSSTTVHGLIASVVSNKYFGCDLLLRNMRHDLSTGSNSGVYMNGYDLTLGGGSWQVPTTTWYFGGSDSGTVTPEDGTATITVYSTGAGTSGALGSYFVGGMKAGTLNGDTEIIINSTSGNDVSIRGGGVGASGSNANVTGNVTNTITGVSTTSGGVKEFLGGVEYGNVDGRITNRISGGGRFVSNSTYVAWGSGASYVGGSLRGNVGTDATLGGAVNTSNLSGLESTGDYVIKNIIDTSGYNYGNASYVGTNNQSGTVKGNIVNVVKAGANERGAYISFSGGSGLSAAIGGSWQNSFSVSANTTGLTITNVSAGLAAAKSAAGYQLYGNITNVVRAGSISNVGDNNHWFRGAGWGYMEGNAYSAVGTEGIAYLGSYNSYTYSTTTTNQGENTVFDMVGGGGTIDGDNSFCIVGDTTLVTQNVLARWTYGGSFGGVQVGDSTRVHSGGVVDTCEGTGYMSYIHIGDGRAELRGGQVDWFLSGGGWGDTYQVGNVSVEVYDEPNTIINASMGGTYGLASHYISGNSTIIVRGGNFSGTAGGTPARGFSAGPSNAGYIFGNASVTIDLRGNQHGFSIEAADSISGGRRLGADGSIYLGSSSSNTIVLTVLTDDSQTNLLNGLSIYGDCASASGNISNTRAGKIIINVNAPEANIGNLYATNYSNITGSGASAQLLRDVRINLVSAGTITGIRAGNGSEALTSAIVSTSAANGKAAVIYVGPQSTNAADILGDRETAQTANGLPPRINVSSDGIISFTAMDIRKRLLVAQSGDIKNASGATAANHGTSYYDFGNLTIHAGEGMDGAGLGIASTTASFIAGETTIAGSGKAFVQSTGKVDQIVLTSIAFEADGALSWLKVGNQSADTNLQTKWFGSTTGWRVITLNPNKASAEVVTPINFRGFEESTGKTFIGDSDTHFSGNSGYVVAIPGSIYTWKVISGAGKVSHNVTVSTSAPSAGQTIDAYGTVAKDTPSTEGSIAIPTSKNTYPTFSFLPTVAKEEWVEEVNIYGSDRYIAPPGRSYTITRGLPAETKTWTASGTDIEFSFDIEAEFSMLAELTAQDVILTESEAAAIVDADDIISYTQAEGRPFFRNNVTAQMLDDIRAPLSVGLLLRSHSVTYSAGHQAQTGSEVSETVRVIVVRDGSVLSPDRKYAVYAKDVSMILTQAQAITGQSDLDSAYTHAIAILADGTTATPTIDNAAIPAITGVTAPDVPADIVVHYSYAPDILSTPVEKSVHVRVVTDQANLTVSNTVMGDYADRTKEFTFTVTLWDSNNVLFSAGTVLSVTGDISVTTLTVDANGQVTFPLKHGQTVVIQDAPRDGRVQIVESARDNYGVTTFIADGSGVVETGWDTNVRLMNSEDRAFAFSNARNTVVPTGIFLDDSLGMILLVIALPLSLGLVAGMVYRTRRKRS